MPEQYFNQKRQGNLMNPQPGDLVEQPQGKILFEAMRLDLELEQQIKELTGKEKLTSKVVREFVVKIVGN